MKPENRTPADAEIGAWVDGALDSEGAARMSELVASDEAVALRALRLRHIDGLVRAAVPRDDDIPAELLARLGLAGMDGAADVSSIAAARLARESKAAARAAPRWLDSAGWRRIAAQVALVLGLGTGAAIWLAPHGSTSGDAAYRTLGDRPAADAAQADINALLVFAEGTNAATARRIAQDAGARLVGTPSDAGAWQAAITPSRRDAVLEVLRRDDRVALAEAIDGSRP